MTFQEARARFPVLERFAYLNAGSLAGFASSSHCSSKRRPNRRAHQLDHGRLQHRLFRARPREQLRITIPSYFAHKSIDPQGALVPVGGAVRFDSGWLAPPALAGLEAALDGLPEWRFDRAAEITERCRRALATGHELIGETGQGTLVSFVPPGDPADTRRSSMTPA